MEHSQLGVSDTLIFICAVGPDKETKVQSSVRGPVWGIGAGVWEDLQMQSHTRGDSQAAAVLWR